MDNNVEQINKEITEELIVDLAVFSQMYIEQVRVAILQNAGQIAKDSTLVRLLREYSTRTGVPMVWKWFVLLTPIARVGRFGMSHNRQNAIKTVLGGCIMLDPQNIDPRQEQHEYFKDRITKKRRCQYDYRTMDGELFSCVKPTLEDCLQARDKWLLVSGRI